MAVSRKDPVAPYDGRCQPGAGYLGFPLDIGIIAPLQRWFFSLDEPGLGITAPRRPGCRFGRADPGCEAEEKGKGKKEVVSYVIHNGRGLDDPHFLNG